MKGLERLCKHLDLLSAPAKPVAKLETIVLYKEVFRWVGEAGLKEFKIHTEVRDELAKYAKEYNKEPLEIKRGIKSQAPVNGQSLKPVYYMEEEEEENREPVDVLGPYTFQWVDHIFSLDKWKEKKEELDQFIKKIKVPSILPPREVSHFISLIKRLLADNNINICYCGFYITQHMSKGLRRDFAHIANNIKN